MSIIYSMECQACGSSLEYEVRLDADEDLRVDVEPCTSCIESAKGSLQETLQTSIDDLTSEVAELNETIERLEAEKEKTE